MSLFFENFCDFWKNPPFSNWKFRKFSHFLWHFPNSDQNNDGCYSHFCGYLGNLKLTDFPLGSGDWKSEKFRSVHPNLESLDNLKDTSNLSIYDFDENWCGQASKLRQEMSSQFFEKNIFRAYGIFGQNLDSKMNF